MCNALCCVILRCILNKVKNTKNDNHEFSFQVVDWSQFNESVTRKCRVLGSSVSCMGLATTKVNGHSCDVPSKKSTEVTEQFFFTHGFFPPVVGLCAQTITTHTETTIVSNGTGGDL